jgi:hypothetical protein
MYLIARRISGIKLNAGTEIAGKSISSGKQSILTDVFFSNVPITFGLYFIDGLALLKIINYVSPSISCFLILYEEIHVDFLSPLNSFYKIKACCFVPVNIHVIFSN